MSSSSSNRVIAAVLVVAVLAIGFWILLLSPKREKASELGTEVEQQQIALAQAQAQATEGTEARRQFPSDYRQLVVLGQAIPAGDETASLLVELNRVADRAEVEFRSLQLSSSEGSEAPSSAVTAPQVGAESAIPTEALIPPTEAEAALLPLGAKIGSAGLGVMPYNLSFNGSFFHVADFIEGLDSMVHTDQSEVAVDGRLITLDGFSLTEDTEAGFPQLNANFSVTTYLVSPEQGTTAGATATSPPAAAVEPSATEAPPSTTSTAAQ